MNHNNKSLGNINTKILIHILSCFAVPVFWFALYRIYLSGEVSFYDFIGLCFLVLLPIPLSFLYVNGNFNNLEHNISKACEELFTYFWPFRFCCLFIGVFFLHCMIYESVPNNGVIDIPIAFLLSIYDPVTKFYVVKKHQQKAIVATKKIKTVSSKKASAIALYRPKQKVKNSRTKSSKVKNQNKKALSTNNYFSQIDFKNCHEVLRRESEHLHFKHGRLVGFKSNFQLKKKYKITKKGIAITENISSGKKVKFSRQEMEEFLEMMIYVTYHHEIDLGYSKEDLEKMYKQIINMPNYRRPHFKIIGTDVVFYLPLRPHQLMANRR